MKHYLRAFVPIAMLELLLGVSGNFIFEWLKGSHQIPFWTILGVLQLAVLIGAIAITRVIERKRFRERCDHFHSFLHRLRDLSIMCSPSDMRPRSDAAASDLIDAQHGHKLSKMLDSMAETLQLTVPSNVNIFTAIRERRADGSYESLKYRGGKTKQDRHESSLPLLPNAPMITRLLRSYNDDLDCVIITGSEEDEWIKELPNNKHKEDLSVLMGAIFRKVWVKDGNGNGFPKEQRVLEWILCAAANKKDIFNDSHKPLMKCFNDSLGILLNQIVRSRDPNTQPNTAKESTASV